MGGVSACVLTEDWANVAHSETLWRSIAQRCGYSHADDAYTRETYCRYLCEAHNASVSGYFDDVSDFGALCKKVWTLDRCWGMHRSDDADQEQRPRRRVELRPEVHPLRPTGTQEDVHRIKLDPFDQCVIVTGRHGGVRSLDAITGDLLWSISPSETRDYPHLEFSEGYMVFDRLGAYAVRSQLTAGIGHFEVWRSERLLGDLSEEARRGAFRRYTILTTAHPVRAYRFQYPTLVCSTLDGFVLQFDVPQKTLTHSFAVSGGVNEGLNVNYIDFDDNFIFLVGNGCDAVTVLHRETGEVAWALFDYIDQHGPPDSYTSDAAPSSGQQAFHKRRLSRRATPPRWYTAHRSMIRASTGLYVWYAVHPDHETDTLVLLSQGGLLFIRNYTAYFRDRTRVNPDMFYYAFPMVRTAIQHPLESKGLGKGWQNRLVHQTHGQLSVAKGRVLSVFGLTTLIDLRTPSRLDRDNTRIGTNAPDDGSLAPMTVYEWADIACLGSEKTEQLDTFMHCSCVQMDQVRPRVQPHLRR